LSLRFISKEVVIVQPQITLAKEIHSELSLIIGVINIEYIQDIVTIASLVSSTALGLYNLNQISILNVTGGVGAHSEVELIVIKVGDVEVRDLLQVRIISLIVDGESGGQWYCCKSISYGGFPHSHNLIVASSGYLSFEHKGDNVEINRI
jgi:hypothetical protein